MAKSIRSVLEEGGEFFRGQSPVQKAALRICKRLDEMNVPYALVGGLAVNRYGRVRMTEDVDILVTAEGLAEFKKQWLGRGWVEKFAGSKSVRDTDANVPIDFLITGEIPGDGKTAPFGFPPPEDVFETDEDGIRVITLPKLIELKIASALTSPHRPRDLDDVIQLIRTNELARDYGAQLHEYVRPKFNELWGYAQHEE